MKWPWRRETRADAPSYTAMVLDGLADAAAAAGPAADPSGLATVTACAGQWADWLSACAVTGPPCITRGFLATVALDLVRRGASRWRISVRDGVILLDRPSRALRVHGGWQFTWTPDPGRQFFEELLDAEVLNLRWEHDAEFPWRGRPPWAGLTGRLVAELEHMLGDEAAGPAGTVLTSTVGQALGTGDTMSQRVAEELRGRDDKAGIPAKRATLDLRGRRRGSMVVVQHTGMGTAGQALHPMRVGATWPESIADSRAQFPREIAGACGVPWELVAGGPGSTLREGHRLATERVAARARRIADDLTEALGVNVELDASELHRADVMSRTRSLKGLVDAGMTLDEARRVVGL